ncbi:hypothetical protein WJX81_003418 [Elliptochloris bilobata]|uniref:CRC domain-containing protein n=1 Tax=Elliptochloris bilobata TaxID=381761 RepID=A0AAW1S5H9_9CHLO
MLHALSGVPEASPFSLFAKELPPITPPRNLWDTSLAFGSWPGQPALSPGPMMAYVLPRGAGREMAAAEGREHAAGVPCGGAGSGLKRAGSGDLSFQYLFPAVSPAGEAPAGALPLWQASPKRDLGAAGQDQRRLSERSRTLSCSEVQGSGNTSGNTAPAATQATVGLPNGGASSARAGGAAAQAAAQAWQQPARSLRTVRRRSLHFYEDGNEDDQDSDEPPLKNCSNKAEYGALVAEQREAVRQRNPQAFEEKIAKVEAAGPGGGGQHKRGCHCKKSHCKKKYCECFQAGVNCGEHCKCDACLNTPEHGLPPAPKPSKSRRSSAQAAAAAATGPGRPAEKSPGTPPVKAAHLGNPNLNPASEPDPRRGSARKQRRPLPAAAPSGAGGARAGADYWPHTNGGYWATGRGGLDVRDASASPPDSDAARGVSPSPSSNPGEGNLAAPERLKEDSPEAGADHGGNPDRNPGDSRDAGATAAVLTMGAVGPYVLMPCAAGGRSAAGGEGGSGDGGGEMMQLMVSTPDGQLISLGALPPALCPGELQMETAAPAAAAEAGAGADTPGAFASPGALLEGDAGATFGAFSGTPTLWTHQREQETVAGGMDLDLEQLMLGTEALGTPAGPPGATVALVPYAMSAPPHAAGNGHVTPPPAKRRRTLGEKAQEARQAAAAAGLEALAQSPSPAGVPLAGAAAESPSVQTRAKARRVSCSPGDANGAGALVRPMALRAAAPISFPMPAAACRDVPLARLLASSRCGAPASPPANGLLGGEHVASAIMHMAPGHTLISPRRGA